MRDLFSQCMCVRVYVCTCRSRLGMSICSIAWEYQFEVTLECQFALMLRNTSLKRAFNTRRCRWSWRMKLGGRFSAMEDGEDRAAGPSQRTYLVESSAETSAERSQWLATLTKKRSVHHRSQESKKRTTKSSKVESTY